MMYHPDVEPHWYQIPFKLFNATSATDHWLQCWDAGREADWVHPKDSINIKESVYGPDRFAKLFGAILQRDYPSSRVAIVGGAREAPLPISGGPAIDLPTT